MTIRYEPSFAQILEGINALPDSEFNADGLLLKMVGGLDPTGNLGKVVGVGAGDTAVLLTNSAGVTSIIGSQVPVDLAAAAVTPVYALVGAEKVVVSRIEIRCSSAGAVTVSPSFSLGFGAGTDEIVSVQTTVDFDSVDQVWAYSVMGSYVVENSGDTIGFRVVSPSDAPMTGVVTVFGRFI